MRTRTLEQPPDDKARIIALKNHYSSIPIPGPVRAVNAGIGARNAFGAVSPAGWAQALPSSVSPDVFYSAVRAPLPPAHPVQWSIPPTGYPERLGHGANWMSIVMPNARPSVKSDYNALNR